MVLINFYHGLVIVDIMVIVEISLWMKLKRKYTGDV